MELLAFGDSFVDPALVAALRIQTDPRARPAPGEREAGEGGRRSQWVVSATLNFRHAAPDYTSLGYASAEDARRELDRLRAELSRHDYHFVELAHSSWARADLVGSIEVHNNLVKVYLDLHAPTPALQASSGPTPSAEARRQARELADEIRGLTAEGD